MNQMPATLLRAVEKLERVRLEFADDIAVEMDRRPIREISRALKEWVIEFPSDRLADSMKRYCITDSLDVAATSGPRRRRNDSDSRQGAFRTRALTELVRGAVALRGARS